MKTKLLTWAGCLLALSFLAAPSIVSDGWFHRLLGAIGLARDLPVMPWVIERIMQMLGWS